MDGNGLDTSELHMADSCSNYEADGAGNEISHCPGLDAFNAEFIAGLFGQAFHFTGNDHLEVRHSDPTLDADFVSMVAWVRPTGYDTSMDRGIIMNKEASYEMGLQVWGHLRLLRHPTDGPFCPV
jgi:hypothetical protein